MGGIEEGLVVLAVVVGLVGAIVQVIPGALIVLVAALVWAVVTGGGVGWTVGVVATLAVVVSAVAKYYVAGRYLGRGGVPNRTIVVGAVVGVVGFFVVPVVGLPLGFVLGVYLMESARLRAQGDAWRATWRAMKATGLSILIELAGALVAAGALFLGMWRT
ncbi:DUF456 domain-containing protein [Georgenia faecalis]|uniref:DUF456 domain-containing protein n=1 Tax=Georgenia faecalis TaxID=2483799 RepID=A0ABV9D7N9_9MICO|nr:DUF456 domain-containing protein [Georgenia faecalis]